jgi:hypothetical protein
VSEPTSGFADHGHRRHSGKPRDDKPELYKLAYEEGQRTVDDQLSELDSMRQRSVQFLAFVGTATAFLVGTSLRAYPHSEIFFILAGAATALALATIGLCVAVLNASRKLWSPTPVDWSFRLSPSVLVKWIEPDVHPPSDADFYKHLALHYEEMATENDVPLHRIRNRYLTFLGVGFLQLTLWLAVAWIFG